MFKYFLQSKILISTAKIIFKTNLVTETMPDLYEPNHTMVH